jgi:hypothetical protein
MATKAEIHALVLKRIRERIGADKPCTLCGHTNWALDQSFVTLPANNNPSDFNSKARTGFPNAVYFCQHCGNSHLLNLLILGLDLEAIKASDVDGN